MFVRFTEFLTFHEKEICLYFKQEDDGEGLSHFNVIVIYGTTSELILCKKIDNSWKNVTQTVPRWIKEMEPAIISVIELKTGVLRLGLA